MRARTSSLAMLASCAPDPLGPLSLPIALLCDMAMFHEYRGQGCGSSLLHSAEQRMAAEGAVLAVLRTRAPQFFRRRGWCVSARHSFSVARPAEILALLRERAARRPSLLTPAQTPITIRLWRQVERDALVRLYEQNAAGSYGLTMRGEDYWAWLLNRGAYDCIYIAIDGPDNFALQAAPTAIVSYGVMREGRLVELMTSPDQPRACQQLLMRTCGDAIEHDLPALRVDAPPLDPVHELFADAHGDRCHPEADKGDVYLIKTLDPLALLRHTAELLYRRARRVDFRIAASDCVSPIGASTSHCASRGFTSMKRDPDAATSSVVRPNSRN